MELVRHLLQVQTRSAGRGGRLVWRSGLIQNDRTAGQGMGLADRGTGQRRFLSVRITPKRESLPGNSKITDRAGSYCPMIKTCKGYVI